MRERIKGYENVKFVLIFLVVLGHFVEKEYSFESGAVKATFFGIYVFHMPAFIFLSGLMHRVDKAINWQRVFSFFLLGYSYKIMNTLVDGIGTGEWRFSFWNEEGIPWFMFAMAVFPILTYVFRNVKPAFVMGFSILLACVLAFDPGLKTGALTLGRIVTYFPFYMAGCYLDAEKVMAFCKKKWVMAISAVYVVAYVVVVYTKIEELYPMRHIVTGKNPYSDWALEHGHMMLRLGCYLVAALMILALISLIPNRRIPLVTTGGGRTLSVYFWHNNIIKILAYTGIIPMIISRLGGGLWIAWVFALVLTLVLIGRYWMIPLDYMMKGIFNKKETGK